MLTTKDAVALRFVLMAREHAEAVGRRMRLRREALGLTQREVADRMPPPIDGNYISRWERGEHKPSDDTLDMLAVALETTTSALLADAPDKSQTPEPFASNGNQLERIEQKLDEVLRRLSEPGAGEAAPPQQSPPPSRRPKEPNRPSRPVPRKRAAGSG